MPCSRPLGLFYIILLNRTLNNSIEPPDEANVRAIYIVNKLRTSSPLANFHHSVKRLFQFLLLGSHYIAMVLTKREVVPNPPNQRGFHVLGKESYITWGLFITQWCERCQRVVSVHRDVYFGALRPPHLFLS